MSAPTSLADLGFVNPHRQASLAGSWAEVPAPAPPPWTEADGARLESPDEVPVRIHGAGTTLDLAGYLAATYATSLLVVRPGEAGAEPLLEWYADGLGPRDLFLGASMTKSALACLVGRAVDAGLLALEARLDDLVPGLSGYADRTVLDVLTMTSGMAWVEDHRDPDSPASRLLAAFRDGSGGSRELVAAIPAAVPAGRRWVYNTADSQMLDWAREAATGEPFAEAVRRLWADLGCETPALVGLDAPEGAGVADGVALAGGGLAAGTRDWARIGLLQLTGRARPGGADQHGAELLSEEWRRSIAEPAYPFMRVGRLPSTITTHAGFGRHWWPTDDAGTRVMADGSRGQFTLVDHEHSLVVVQTSGWPFADFVVDRQCRDLAYLGLPTIAAAAAERGAA